MLAALDVSRRFAHRLVLEHVSLIVNPGDRIGLVGPNGAGKSTLLSILAGHERPDQGAVSRSPGLTVGLLRQGFADLVDGRLRDLLDPRLDGVLQAQQDLHDSLTALQDGDDAATLDRYDQALDRFERLGGYPRLDALTEMLHRLGAGDLDLDRPLATLSGGQKTRAGLAALLVSQADVLLLDEPTNHLDQDALRWLDSFVAGYQGAVVVVSHDRTFLDTVTNQTAEIDHLSHRLTVYPGNYSSYRQAKTAEEEQYAASFARQQTEIARIERDIRSVASHAMQTERATQHDFLRGRAKKVARTAKVRERKLERTLASAAHLERPQRRWGMALDFGAIPETSQLMARLNGVDITLGNRPVLEDVHLEINAGDRVAVTGPNGGGKTTLLRLLSGELQPDRGIVSLGPSVRPGIFDQEQRLLDLEQTVLEQTRLAAPLSEAEARNYLHLFLFAGDSVLKPAAMLSYGERARLALALLTLRGANFLLLDEPLNHLDLPSREQFEQALTNFEGTVVIVLHDRYAIDRIATRQVEIRDHRLRVR